MPGGFLLDNDDFQMLPPPLLDDSSDARSFEGLLGVRRMREQLARSQYLDQLRLANRPAHRVDTFTAFFNFVRSAQASESRRQKSRGHAAQAPVSELPAVPLGKRRYSGSHVTEEAVSSALPERSAPIRRSAPAISAENLADSLSLIHI